jgi:formylglycine-generating enzyme required for sulfatase activity
MVMVPTTSGTSFYCIDATEVTIGAYAAFLQSNPSLSLLPPSCTGKSSFVPGSPLDMSRSTYPVGQVDWCDAYGYCANLGRHICGRIGGGATLGASESPDATKSEWYNACSKGGTRTFCYGSTFNPIACVDNQPAPVGSAALCVGGFAGIHDMNLNIAEWEDNCQGTAGLTDQCTTRGGSFSSNNQVTCAMADRQRRNVRSSSIGFRCCL